MEGVCWEDEDMILADIRVGYVLRGVTARKLLAGLQGTLQEYVHTLQGTHGTSRCYLSPTP